MQVSIMSNFEHQNSLVQQIKQLYKEFGDVKLSELNQIYTQDVHFIDPLHELQSVTALNQYFNKSGQNLNYCRFSFLSELVGEQNAFLSWRMDYSHSSIKNGEPQWLLGMSELRYTEKVFFHQDSYDVGKMVYQHVPVLGRVVKAINNRMAGA